jgi:DNA-binding IclR family transcriptional regulator
MPVKKNIIYSAPALDKGLDILEYLAEQPIGRSQAEIGAALTRSQSEIYRMLACLEQRGYVVKVPPTGTYRLSLRLFELAHRQNTTALLRQAALLPMDAAADETRQSIHLSVQHGNDLLVMVERMPARRICLAVGEGTTMPLSQAASGKVLLSRLAKTDAHAILKDDTFFQGATVVKRRAILEGIAQARRTGLLMAASEITPGVMDIAVPVGVAGSDTDAVIAMSFILPAKAGDKICRKYTRVMRGCAAHINQNLGVSFKMGVSPK